MRLPAFLLGISLATGCYDPDLAETGLELEVEGKGEIVSHDLDLRCAADEVCVVTVPIDVPVMLEAIEVHKDWEFAGWAASGCAGSSPACLLEVPIDGAVVVARFERDHPHDDDDDD
jgi:hypothetical protein